MASPKRIRVAAVSGILASVPGAVAVHGGQAEYVGRRTCHKGIAETTRVRKHDGIKVLDDHECAYPPDANHNSTFDSETHLEIFGELRRLIREGSIAAADAATAAWAGVRLPVSSPTAFADHEDA